MINQDDHTLVLETLQGNQPSFGILVERYEKKIYGMILQMTDDHEAARDLTQEIFLKAYLNLSSFNLKHRFFSWIYRISLNETINYLKRRKRFQPLESALSIPAVETDSIHESAAEKKIRETLRNLREDYRSLILLKYWFGLSYEEIAETLGISTKKVKNRLYYARLTFRDKLLATNYFQ